VDVMPFRELIPIIAVAGLLFFLGLVWWDATRGRDKPPTEPKE
jgi:hypothetical protein